MQMPFSIQVLTIIRNTCFSLNKERKAELETCEIISLNRTSEEQKNL